VANERELLATSPQTPPKHCAKTHSLQEVRLGAPGGPISEGAWLFLCSALVCKRRERRRGGSGAANEWLVEVSFGWLMVGECSGGRVFCALSGVRFGLFGWCKKREKLEEVMKGRSDSLWSCVRAAQNWDLED